MAWSNLVFAIILLAVFCGQFRAACATTSTASIQVSDAVIGNTSQVRVLNLNVHFLFKFFVELSERQLWLVASWRIRLGRWLVSTDYQSERPSFDLFGILISCPAYADQLMFSRQASFLPLIGELEGLQYVTDTIFCFNFYQNSLDRRTMWCTTLLARLLLLLLFAAGEPGPEQLAF